MDAYLLHCLNHVSKTADRIKRNNTRLEAAGRQQGEGGVGAEDLPRDQVRAACRPAGPSVALRVVALQRCPACGGAPKP